MSTWPFWVYIGLLIFASIARVALIGKTIEIKYTPGRAIASLAVNGLMIYWLLTIMKHLC